ncbi:Extracellular solute-binding protein [Rhodovastum atsumiense]|uniref:Extracellular solute-binding protein n=1 Tax=Rhodovastum atsumiense TaxID=504468 RepID=A0A5M6J1L5_9PROT|nr:extracellular solute-binding protein [Rhodovastum atsumiense]KAA5614109.1 extracellular solute-binding protein [Rhodovastum atsumiense]CAH2598952.1 Extracellular solute-binding protein [Rhodovastum atsumiense]
MTLTRRAFVASTGLAAAGLAAPAIAQSKVEITYWQYSFPVKETAINALIPVFEKQNPGIRVRHETFPYANFNTKVAVAVPAGSGPDVVNLFYGWIPQYLKGGYLQPLPAGVISPAAIEAEFFPLVQAAKVNGSYYALPTAVRSLALFTNRKLFREAGLDPAQAPRTLAEYRDLAIRLTRRDASGNITVAGSTMQPSGQHVNWIREVLVRQFGGTPYSADFRKVTYDSPAGVAAMRWYLDLIRRDRVGFPDFMTDDVTAFRAGRAAMTIDGSFRLAALNGQKELDFGVAELPEHEGRRANFASFWANGITRNATGARAEAAARFVAFLASPDVMGVWLEKVGELPARKAVGLTPANLAHPQYGPFIRGLEYASATAFVDELGQRQVLLDAVDDAVASNRPAEEVVRRMAQREQDVIDAFYAH